MGEAAVGLIIIALIASDETKQIIRLSTIRIHTNSTPGQFSPTRPISGSTCSRCLLQCRVRFIRCDVFTVPHHAGSQIIHNLFREIFTGIKYIHVAVRIHIHTLGVISAVQLIAMAIHCHHRIQSRSRSTPTLGFTIAVAMPARRRRRITHINIGQSDICISMVTERIKTTMSDLQSEGLRQPSSIAPLTMAVHAQRRTTPQIHIRRANGCHLNLYPAGTQ